MNRRKKRLIRPVPITIIAISLIVFGKLLKKWRTRNITPENTSSISRSSSSASSSTNSASDSLSTLVGEYEVFLSFNGKDTRKGFTDYLYNDLLDARIHTFRDDNELRVGKEIGPELLKAIKDSKISIPIFSKNYASSKWCLLELEQMIQCHTSDGQQIFPIFYDVSPFDVRHQTGSYKKAFHQHERNFDAITVQRWKEALAKVGKLKGLELEKETLGYEGELVKMVVEKVLSELRKNYKHVNDNLVGMDHHLKEMKRLLNVDSQGVRIVGIHGMGGIGKTTIAKFTYNQLCERFELCCFLEDVRATSEQHNGLINLQIQLISKIGRGKGSNIYNVDDGINKINDLIRSKNILIILDDVDEKSQFDKLVGKWGTAGSGSRIIVTTRNKEFLDQLKVTCQNKGQPEIYRSYEPQFMDHDLSLRLFCKYAFMRDLPPEDYDMLAEEIISTAAGLPLVLVTIGSLLLDKDKAYWKETSKRLKDIPHEEVMKKLRISFEALNVQQKQIFLDIACLFIGENKENPFYMWDDCKYYPETGINALVLRSLVKVRDDNSLWMHDQLRDLGRQIIEENSDELGERSRLWRLEEALKVLDRRMGTKNVVALALDLSQFPESGRRCLWGEEFDELPNLRYLRAGYAYMAGDFKHHLSKLRWLVCRGSSDEFTPTNCDLENLVILDLSESEVTDNWEGWNQIKMATKLKVLNLSSCSSLSRSLDFSVFATLEILTLSFCSGLREIDPSIGNLTNLRDLNVSCCAISRIDGLEQLESLRYLDISCCFSLERLPDLSNLKQLIKLNMTFCSKLTEVRGLDSLESLQRLDMMYCSSIERLPDLSNLGMLKQLILDNCSQLSEVTWANSQDLILENLGNGGLKGLTALELLNISGCKLIEKLPDLKNLINLKEINACGCNKLTEIQGIEELRSLESLNIGECESIEKLPNLSNLTNFKTLNASQCVKLTEIRRLEELKALEFLNIDRCESIEKLPDLSNLTILKELKVSGCVKLTEIHGLECLKSLESLDIAGCKLIEKLTNLSKLTNLKEILARGCDKLTEIGGPEELKSLEWLDLLECKSIEKLLYLSNLTSLQRLMISHCVKLSEIPGLEELKSLEHLTIDGCESIEKLPDLSNLENLRTISARDCVKLTEIRGLEKLKSGYMNITGSHLLIQNLPHLPNIAIDDGRSL